MKVQIKHTALCEAAEEGMDAFLKVIVDAIRQEAGGELNAESMAKLSPDQSRFGAIRFSMRNSWTVASFVIYNGYGPFFFDNPFAKAMRLWGLREFSKLLYKAKALYDERKVELTRERSDEEFMALFEQNPEFDELMMPSWKTKSK